MVSLRAVVHIGPMKTGTTAFAAACTQAAANGSLPQGLLYPTGSLWFDDDRSVVKHHQLNAPARGDHAARRARDRARPGVDELERALVASASTARSGAVDGSAVVVLVAEGLSHQVNPHGLTEQLLQHVDAIDYVLVARRQQRAIGSIIAHGVKDVRAVKRRQLSVEDHLSRSARVRRFDYARILDGWRHDGATLHVVPYDESAAGSTWLSDTICDRVGIARLPVSESLAARRSHPSFSEEGLRELAALKRRYWRWRWLPRANERYREAFAVAWDRHHRLAREGAIERWRLSDVDEKTVSAAYAESNRRFRAQLGVEAETPLWHEWFTAVGIDSPAPSESAGRA